MSDSIKPEVANYESETLKCLNDIKELLTLLLVKTGGKPWRDVSLGRELEEVVSAKDGLGDLWDDTHARYGNLKLAYETGDLALAPVEQLIVDVAKSYWSKSSHEMKRFKADQLTFKDLCVGIGLAENNKNPTRLMRQKIDVPLRNAVGDELVADVLKRLSRAESDLLNDYLGRVKGASLSKFPLSKALFGSICVILQIKDGMDSDLYLRFFR
jgi:hypothetical protein